MISAPASAITPEDNPLAFSLGNGLLITISDVDVFGGQMNLMLSVSNGTLTFGNTTGLMFLVGANGSSSFTVSGTLADINNALCHAGLLAESRLFRRGLASDLYR